MVGESRSRGLHKFDIPLEAQEGTPADGFEEEAAARYGYHTGRGRGRYPNTVPCRPTPVGKELLTGLGIEGGRSGYDMPVEVRSESVPTDDFEGAVARCGYHSPTPVRRYPTLAGRDLMPCAHTGSGILTALCIPVEAGGRGKTDLTPKKSHNGAQRVIAQMQGAGVKPDAETYCDSEEKVSKYLDELRQDGIQMTKYVDMALINAYSRLGNSDMTKQEHTQTEGELDRLYQLLEEVNESSMWFDGCSRVLQYCVQHNYSDDTIDLLRQLKERNEMSAYMVVDQVFCQIWDMEPVNLDVGMELFHAVKELGLNVSWTSLDFLLNACLKANDSQCAQRIWTYESSGLPQNVLTYLRMYQALFLQAIPKDDPHVRCIIYSCKMTSNIQGRKPSAVIRPSPEKKVAAKVLGLINQSRLTDETESSELTEFLGDSFTCGDKGCTQIFVNLCGRTISLQEDLTKLDINMLTEAACIRAGVKPNDFYSTFAGKILEPNQRLSHYKIQRNSTIDVTPRLRGGCSGDKNWDQIIDGIHDRFHVVTLPPDLVDQRKANKGPGKAKFLAEELQYRCTKVLIYLCRNHLQGISFGGAFTAKHILFDGDGNVRIDAVQKLSYTKPRAFGDYKATEEIFDKVFKDEDDKYAILAFHLIKFLRNPPPQTDPQSEEIISFVTNHGSLLTYAQRIAISTILDALVIRLDEDDMIMLQNAMPITFWTCTLPHIQAMSHTFFHNSWRDQTGYLHVHYWEAGTSLVHYSNNFFKHTPTFTLEELDAAFSFALDEHNFVSQLMYDTLVTFKERYKLDGKPVPLKVQQFLDAVICMLGKNTIGCKRADSSP